MKLLSLNAWEGTAYEALTDYIQSQKDQIDIFCFQEFSSTEDDTRSKKAHLFSEVKEILNNYQPFYFTYRKIERETAKSQFELLTKVAIFVKNDFEVIYRQNYFIYRSSTLKITDDDYDHQAVPLQMICIKNNQKKYYIFNLHGTPIPGDKLDSPRRIQHSQKIAKIMSYFRGPKILVGDFNLLPETQSIKILEKKYINLIKKFEIKKTRSRLSPFWGSGDFQSYADYTFVSKDIQVKSFVVPDIQVSDHLPMILEFE